MDLIYNDDRNLLTKRLYSPHDSKSLINEGSLSDVPSTNYFHHSITTNSYGLLTDSRTGGLKRDLSLAFSEYYKDKYEDKESSSWKNDFNQNFIFRDRVEARKNFPLGPQAKRNQWYVEATNPVVLDDDALLAGPSWSVLADYHNLYKKYGEVLKVDPPDEFPRIVGDNLLIFDRKGPQSHPASPNKFKNPRDALPYYNCFPYPLRAIRPEPQNHSIFPVITGFKFSLCPVIDPDDTEKSFALSFNPNVTVWNPYNKTNATGTSFFKSSIRKALLHSELHARI